MKRFKSERKFVFEGESLRLIGLEPPTKPLKSISLVVSKIEGNTIYFSAPLPSWVKPGDLLVNNGRS